MNTPFSRLSDKQGIDVEDFLAENQGLSKIRGKGPHDLDAWECVSAWLQYNGIQGYTDQIVDLVRRAYGDKK